MTVDLEHRLRVELPELADALVDYGPSVPMTVATGHGRRRAWPYVIAAVVAAIGVLMILTLLAIVAVFYRVSGRFGIQT